VNDLTIDAHLAGANGGLRLGPAFGVAVFDEKNVCAQRFILG
jgi:hypothetical protein